MYKQDLTLNDLQGLWYAFKYNQPTTVFAQLAGAAEYTDCFSAER